MQEKNDDFINLLPTEVLASKETFFVNAQKMLTRNKKAHDISTEVAHGKQAEVEQLLIKLPIVQAQGVLSTPVPFTDYSGRTFHCTAYEYSYWAKRYTHVSDA